MSYLLDKKNQRKKYIYFFVVFFCFSFIFYFRSGILDKLSSFSHFIFRPIITAGHNLSTELDETSAYFDFKKILYLENENLKSKINEQNALMSNYDALLSENKTLKDTLGRKSPKQDLILAAILSKPNRSPYDTILVDVGKEDGVKKTDRVFASGSIPIGYVDAVYDNSANVVLFTSSKEQTEVMLNSKSGDTHAQNLFLEAVGRGGGNFEVVLQRDLLVSKGDELILPGITPYVVGIIESVLSDPRDPFIKALATSPVNIQDLKFVEIER